MYAYTVEPLYVQMGNELIAGDFYRPKMTTQPPVIIMAHGFAALRQFKLIPFAQRFAQAGYAVILFDYRHWGGSTGSPRELVSLEKQIDDWYAVISHVLKSKQVNPHQIILWGTGLSGGYVLQLASELKSIVAAIVQNPFVDGTESAKLYPIQQLPNALRLSSQDYMGAKVGLSPKTLAVVHPYALSFFPTPDSYDGFMSIVHPDYFWSGEVPARALFQLTRFRPNHSVQKIKVPLLVIASKYDQLTNIESTRAMITNIRSDIEYHEWAMSHFEIYHSPWLEKAIKAQLNFLDQKIGVKK